MASNPVDQRGFLLSCAVWQDGLLQSYRTLHLTIQGFLIAAGAAVLAVQLSAAIQVQQSPPTPSGAAFSLLYTCLIGFLVWLQRITSVELKRVIESRARDIDYWHRLLILSENSLAAENRAFTSFKVAQQAKRAEVGHLPIDATPASGMTDERAKQLIEKGLSHTRNALDVNLFRRLIYLWISLLTASAAVSVWFLWSAKVLCAGGV